jgi:hypothetical protein
LEEADRTDNGLDRRYGAGQLDVYRSYFILSGGEQNSVEDGGTVDVAFSGFDYDPCFGGSGCNDIATYPFTADGGHNLLTAALVWHISIDGGDAVLYDMDLELFDNTTGAIVAQSASRCDNSEHLWAALDSGHEYEIRVRRPDQSPVYAWDYALAWTTEGDADRDRVPDDLDNCPLTANRNQIDSDQDGYGNRCDCDLDNNGRVDAGDYWRWRLLATVDPSSEAWDAAVDFNTNGKADAEDYQIFLSRYGQTEPYR